MADTLNFGPEWLRNLSDGGRQAVSSTPTKYRLADYRYGREEMLILYSSDLEAPIELKDLDIFVENNLQPLAFLACSEDKNSQSLNNYTSSRVLQNKHSSHQPPSLTRTEGGYIRSRGRGRSESYGRASIDDDPFPRPRGFKQEPWDDGNIGRGRGRSYDDTGFGDRPDSWRARRNTNEDEDGNWRKSNYQRQSSRNWREPWDRCVEGERWSNEDRSAIYKRSMSSSASITNNHYEEDHDQLPEWSVDTGEELGTFDANGAFMSYKEFEKLEDECLEEKDEIADVRVESNNIEDHNAVELNNNNAQNATAESNNNDQIKCSQNSSKELSQQQQHLSNEGQMQPNDFINKPVLYCSELESDNYGDNLAREVATVVVNDDEKRVLDTKSENQVEDVVKNDRVDLSLLLQYNPQQQQQQQTTNLQQFNNMQQQQNMLQQQLNQLVQQQQQQQQDQQHKMEIFSKGFVSGDHPHAIKWFYKDPQGEIQGPFDQSEMGEWFSAGYFSMSLSVKQGQDLQFTLLGNLLRNVGQNPFIPLSSSRLNIPSTSSLSTVQPFIIPQNQQQQMMMNDETLKLIANQQMASSSRADNLAKISNINQLQLLQQFIQKQALIPNRQAEAEDLMQMQYGALNNPQGQLFHRSFSQPAEMNVLNGASGSAQQQQAIGQLNNNWKSIIQGLMGDVGDVSNLNPQQMEAIKHQAFDKLRVLQQIGGINTKEKMDQLKIMLEKELLAEAYKKIQISSLLNKPINNREGQQGFLDLQNIRNVPPNSMESQLAMINSLQSGGTRPLWPIDRPTNWNNINQMTQQQQLQILMQQQQQNPACSSKLQPAVGQLGGLRDLMQQNVKSRDELVQWCELVLKGHVPPNNIPILIQSLIELTNPVEINNLVKIFLGNTELAISFAAKFIERKQQEQTALLMQYLTSNANSTANFARYKT